MNWLAAKHFLQRAWVWTKNYWYVPLIAVLALVAFFGRRSDVATKLLRTRSDSYKEQIDVLNESHANEIEIVDPVVCTKCLSQIDASGPFWDLSWTGARTSGREVSGLGSQLSNTWKISWIWIRPLILASSTGSISEVLTRRTLRARATSRLCSSCTNAAPWALTARARAG